MIWQSGDNEHIEFSITGDGDGDMDTFTVVIDQE